MDFSDLLFIAVFVIIIVSQIVKQSQKKAKPAGRQAESAKPGLKKVLIDIITDIRKQMEESAQSASGKPTGRVPGWEDIISPPGGGREIPANEPESRKIAESRPKPIHGPVSREVDFDERRTVTSEREARVRRIEELRLKKGKPGVAPLSIQQPDMGFMPEDKWSAEDLRNAVIWNEILSPPLGLREF